MANTVRLPAEGRKGPAPKWPLSKQVATEKQIWAELWALPQAVAWERLGWTRAVARYVRAMVLAESTFQSTLLGEVRQLEDRLGLSPMSMLRLRWEVVEDEVGEARAVRAPKAAGVRERLRAVD